MKDNLQKIMKLLFLAMIAICFYAFSTYAQGVSVKGKEIPRPAKDGLVYMWLFDEGVAGHQFSTVYDTADYWIQEYQTNFFQDTFKGNFEYVEGVSGTAVKFDGFTTRIIRTYIKVPDLTDGFSLEGWVAPYSTRRAAIVSQEKDFKEGFIFGLFGGRLGIQMAINGEWMQCISNVTVPLLKWSHIAVTFEKDKSIGLYLNGKTVGFLEIKGNMTDARKEDLLIGMSQPKELQLREMGGKFPPIDKKLYYHMAYDGLLDELKLYEEALSAKDIKDLYNGFQPAKEQPLKRRMRAIPPKIENPRFGASCCRLRYYDEYEEVQRSGDYADILVRFDLSPARLMFVHSNTYIPIWVTENDKLISDQSVEINGKNGFYEVMMDKQNRYSHVRLLENNDARVVVHWRYALCDRFYEIGRPDEMTGWGDWTDEYYTIYPDGVAVRHWVYYTSTFGKDYLQFQETILHPQPGETNDDNVELEALTLANMEGQTHTYSWAEGVPPYFPKPGGANIQLVNMKSEYKPYIIFEPGSRVDKYIWGYRKGRGYHVSGCLSSGIPVITKGKKRNSYEAVALYGMTENPITELLALAKSWIEPPKLTVTNSGFSSDGYDKYKRAYVLTCKGAGNPCNLEFELAASQESPVVNPAFVIKNWGEADITLQINRQPIERGKAFRYGHIQTPQGTDLVIWIEIEETKHTEIRLNYQQK